MPLPATRRSPTAPRKRPRQERAKDTVEAILAATARVLVEEGFAAATTNRIARLAGVSVGSLYQYFPNKQALVRALYERHLADAESVRPATLRAVAARPGTELRLQDVIRAAVDWHLTVHAKDPRLHQELTRNAPAILGADDIDAFENMHEAHVRARLERHRGELRPRNVAIAAFLVATCMEAVTHGAAARHPEMLQDGELAAELIDMILSYLVPAPRAPHGARRVRDSAR